MLSNCKIPVVISLIIFHVACTKKEVPEEVVAIAADTSRVQTKKSLIYGIEADSSQLSYGKVKWNQFLSQILSEYHVDYQDIHTLAERSKEVYDVRKLKANSDYVIIHGNDSLRSVDKFIFEPTLKEYVIYHLDDSIYAEVGEKPSQIVEKTITAEISSSVYNSILDHEATPLLVGKLVDVFAWQVDFFRIAAGDKFSVIYEVEEVEGEVYDIVNIKGAYFKHLGKEYYAIPYEIDGKVDYFDEQGNSLRKTFLKAPLNYSRISSRYSLRRYHPVQKRYKAHLGTDYAAPTGTPIRTVGDGIVVEAGYHSGNGNYVKIKHNSNYTTQYLHMSKIAGGIRNGKKVIQGETIGYVGSTGLATGPHLCFRFWKNGRQVDALKVDLPSSKGIPSSDLGNFYTVRDSIVARLNKRHQPQEPLVLTMVPIK